MRRALDMAYLAGGAVAGLLIVAMTLLITAQVMLNAATRAFGPVLPSTIPSYADFTGYALAASTFLALAHTLRRGAHVRVTLVTDRLPAGLHRALGVAALLATAGIAGFATWYMGALVRESWRFGDVSSGMVPVPLWAVQTPLVAGLALFAIAALDTALEVARKAPGARHAQTWDA